MRLLCAALLLAWLMPTPAVAQDSGTVTFLEGTLRMIRDTTVYQVTEGVRLKQGDIFESSEMGFVQLELMSGPIVVLGPSSRVYFQHSAKGNSGSGTVQGELLLLSGWLKALSGAHSGLYRYASPLLTATTRDGTVVIHANESGCDVFIETGSATITDTSGREIPTDKPATGNTRQFFSRHPGKARTNSSGPSTVFLAAMPLEFRDDLPSRLGHFTGKPPEPKALHAVAYREIQGWLTTPAQWRKGFVQRFEPRLQDPEFRKQLEAHVAEYPEWEPALQVN